MFAMPPFTTRPAANPLPGAAHALTSGLHRIVLPGTPVGARAALLSVPANWQPNWVAPLAVLLHGASQGPQDAIALLRAQAERAGALVLAPASRASTWDAILGRIGPDWVDMDSLLHWVFAHYAVDTRHLAIGGFSDGASYALSVGLGNGHIFSHALAFSPGFVPRSAVEGDPRILVTHGIHDRVLPIGPCSRQIVPALRHAGYSVDYREFEGGHEVPAFIADAALKWWLDPPTLHGAQQRQQLA